MRAMWVLAANDVRRTVRDRASFLWMLVLPIALMWFFGQFMAGGDRTDRPKVALEVVDQDGGWLARALIEDLDGDAVALTERAADLPPDAERAAPRTLTIPGGFTTGVLAGTRQTVRLQPAEGANQDFSLAAQMHAVRAIVRMIGRLAELEMAGALDDPAAPERFVAFRDRARRVDLEVDVAGRGTPVPAGNAQSVPGILTMMVLMMTVIYGGVFLTAEKREGMLRRQVSAPVSLRALVAGKVLGRAAIAGLQAAVLLVVGAVLFGLSYGSLTGLVVLVASFVFAVAGLSTLVGAIARTAEQASTAGWLLSVVLAALGGCWWPSEVMPGWLQQAAHALPTAWAMDGFHGLISFGGGVPAVVAPSLVLLGFATVFTLLGARFLRPER